VPRSPSAASPSPSAAPLAAAPPAAPQGADPTGYDPSGEIFRGADPVQLFVRAPPDQRWGPVVAAGLLPVMKRDLERLVPGIEALNVTCKLLGCVFQVDGRREALQPALSVLGLVTLGPHTVAAPVSDSRAEMIFFTDRRMADPHAFVTWYLGARRRALAALKSGQRPPLPGIPAERLPDE
jgi:hypothetical protein